MPGDFPILESAFDPEPAPGPSPRSEGQPAASPLAEFRRALMQQAIDRAATGEPPVRHLFAMDATRIITGDFS